MCCVLCNYLSVDIVQFGFAKIKGARIHLHTNSPTFRAAKFNGFTALCYLQDSVSTG